MFIRYLFTTDLLERSEITFRSGMGGMLHVFIGKQQPKLDSDALFRQITETPFLTIHGLPYARM